MIWLVIWTVFYCLYLFFSVIAYLFILLLDDYHNFPRRNSVLVTIAHHTIQIIAAIFWLPLLIEILIFAKDYPSAIKLAKSKINRSY